MKEENKKIWIFIGVFYLVIQLISILLFFLGGEKISFLSLPCLPLFFAILSAVFVFYVKSKLYKRAAAFVNGFMMATFAKLMLHLIIVVVFALTRTQEAVPFLITYFILFMLFTLLELILILPLSRKIKDAQNKQEEQVEQR